MPGSPRKITRFEGGASDWRGPELAPDSWIRAFTGDELDELDEALRFARSTGAGFGELTAADFPLPTVSTVLAGLLDELEHGRGFQLLRGIPVERYDAEDLRFMYWGMGLHLGTAVPQSARNDFLGDVRDLGISTSGRKGRGYTSNEELSYHSDSCDVTGLFCLQTSRSGGHSMIASSIAVHNEMLERRPDLLDVLYEPMPFSRMGSEHSTQRAWFLAPVFSIEDGQFCGQFTRVAAQGVRHLLDAPQPTAAQIEAAVLLEEIAAEAAFVLTFDLEPGDLHFVNNHVTLHNRTAFEDWPDPARRRHLLRLWLSVPGSRRLHPALTELYRDVSPGAVRGGYLTTGLPARFSTLDIAEMR